MTNAIETLKANVEQVAKEKNISALDAITMMQAGCAKTGNEELLEMLCELKWQYI